jgi:hypothetical protein
MTTGQVWKAPETIHEKAQRLSREERLRNRNIKYSEGK